MSASSNIVTTISVVLGIILICIYLYRCWRAKQKVNIIIMITCIIGGAGIVGGVLLLLSPIFPSLLKLLNDLNIYIAIGGISILYVSMSSIIKEIFTRSQVIEDNLSSKDKDN